MRPSAGTSRLPADGSRVVIPMKILARIPALPATADHAAGCAGTLAALADHPDRPGIVIQPADGAADGLVAESGGGDPDRTRADPVMSVGSGDAPARSADRTPSSRLPSPSILVLSLLAVALWAAALRNDRLRLDAARQARAERLAAGVSDTDPPGGSRMR